MKWEYTAIVGKHKINNGVLEGIPKDDLVKLNEYGRQGWEVCNINAVEQINVNVILTSVKLVQTVYFFKRPLQEATVSSA